MQKKGNWNKIDNYLRLGRIELGGGVVLLPRVGGVLDSLGRGHSSRRRGANLGPGPSTLSARGLGSIIEARAETCHCSEKQF